MKRLFALLLICLLPMQVFAGMLTYRTGVIPLPAMAAAATTAPQAQSLAAMTDALAAAQPDAAQQALTGQAEQDEDDNSYADSEDISSHAGLGDEPVLNSAQIFVVDSATLAPAQRSDDASQPPFLPPAARPPRV